MTIGHTALKIDFREEARQKLVDFENSIREKFRERVYEKMGIPTDMQVDEKFNRFLDRIFNSRLFEVSNRITLLDP